MTDRLVLVGHGMVGHTLLTALDARGVLRDRQVTVVAEEDVPPYDRSPGPVPGLPETGEAHAQHLSTSSE
ncbi:hypothetical protein [Streptomyces sp. SP18BB07]|uniref:hypothetical protein n=1 Tax=Streptomyces sp. SP18BB07 TaxID=3002522 RepID=UPI002E79CDC2|nr:hypothetical protein [Streptomyces sp. SP18BB07]MEE1760947.1 hypothetical protein [Streptomyces sp. SP18BB07]